MPHHTSKDIKCPKCASDTIIRIAKKGTNAGEKYFVCIDYPNCKGKVRATNDQIRGKKAIEATEATEVIESKGGWSKETNTRSNQHKILLVILAVGIGIGIQVLLAPLAWVFGEIGILFGTVLGFVVMGYLIYRWLT